MFGSLNSYAFLVIATIFTFSGIAQASSCAANFQEKGGPHGFGNSYRTGHNRRPVNKTQLAEGGFMFHQKEFPKVVGSLTVDYYTDELQGPKADFHLEIDNGDASHTRSVQLGFWDKYSNEPYWLFTVSAGPKSQNADCRVASAFFAEDALTMQVF